MSHLVKSTLPLLLKELKLSTMGQLWETLGARADTEGWGSARYLAALCEHEMSDRDNRRLTRLLKESGLPKGKTFSTLDFSHLPMLNKTQIMMLASGEELVKEGKNILIFGPSGVGKTHLAAAIGAQLIQNGVRVFFTRTTEITQQLQAAKRDLILPAALAKLHKFDCIILDDFGYVKKDSMETSVLFELISERYECKSIILTCNQPFGEWDSIFQDKVMAVAAIDRLVHRATILQLNDIESYRKKNAIKTKDALLEKGT